MWPWLASTNVAPLFYPLICTLFYDKNGNLANNHIKFLWQMKRKAADKHWSNVP